MITENPPSFADLMAHATRALAKLDHFARSSGSMGTTAAVSEAVLVYEQLRDYRKAAKMTALETARLQVLLEKLRARLRFFG
jgi:hypothetical protein